MSVDPRFSPEVERWLAGELDEQQEEALRARLGADALAMLKRAHEADQQALLARMSPERFAQHVHARRAQTARAQRGGRRAFTLSLVAAAAALAVLVVPATREDERATDGDAVRLKGATPSLTVFRRGPAGAQPLANGDVVAARDMLQVAYAAAGRAHGVVLSIDGGGAVTLHSPHAPDGQTRLEPSGRHMLDTAYELDAAPGFERFFFVTADAPIDVSTVLQAAEALARTPERARSESLPLPARHEQTTVLLRKEQP